MPSSHDDDWYRTRAKDTHHDEGVTEIDDEAVVSKNTSGGDGAYVQVWIWIPDGDDFQEGAAHERRRPHDDRGHRGPG